MMLLTKLLETEYISSNRRKEEFSETEIEELAGKILLANGVINPIVVKQVGPLSYAVVEGHLEFYAALRAKEINPGFEEIQVFILTDDPKIDDAIREQVRLLRGKQPVNGDEARVLAQKVLDLDNRLKDLHSMIEAQKKYIDEARVLAQQVLDLDNRLKDLHSMIEAQKKYIIEAQKKYIDEARVLAQKVLDLDNRLKDLHSMIEAQKEYIVELELIKLVREILDKIKPNNSVKRVKINSATLDELTDVPGIGKSRASKIIDLREKHGPFKSFDDLLSKLKRIDKRYIEIWQKTFVFD
jgi:competence ComEA-like helix-hairpin-helix protein